MRSRVRASLALAVVGSVVVAACSSGPGGSPSKGPGGQLVVLMPSSTNAYLAQWEKGAQEKAKALGYEIKIIENNFDQNEQDTQVQQQLASATKPVGYIWWPANQEAGLASLKALKNTGLPVVQTNQLPLAGTEDFWTAYAGVDDILNGWTAADLLIKGVEKAGKSTSDIGNGIIARFPIGYSAGDNRIKGFEQRLTEANITYEILATGDAGFQETEGYKSTSQLLPANKSKGVSWLYGNNDALAIGMAEAAKESGFTAGTDIFIVGGTCHGDPAPVVSGELVGTAIQSAFLEGWLSVQTLHKVLQTGKVEAGNNPDTAKTDPASPPSDSGNAYKYNFMPNPELDAGVSDIFTTTKLWGFTAEQLCSY
jgi:ribose transport system substrate-binding protein